MNPLKVNGGKVMLDFQLQDFPEGIPADDPALASPPHWRMRDPLNGRVICWGHRDGSFEAMVAIMRIAQIGARKATRDELAEAGIVVGAPIIGVDGQPINLDDTPRENALRIFSADDVPASGEVGSAEWWSTQEEQLGVDLKTDRYGQNGGMHVRRSIR